MGVTKELYKYNGFKLVSLDLRGNPLLGKADLLYEFIDPDDSQSSMYTSVIIGPNGTGKSNLFRIIIELFKELYDLKNGWGRSYNVSGLFKMKFSVGGDIFEYANFEEVENVDFKEDASKNAFLLRNGRQIEFERVLLPLAIVANSIILTDKFPFYRKDRDENDEKVDAFPVYKYLGVRNVPQSASTRAYVRRTIEFIVEQFEREKNVLNNFLNAIERALVFLELDKSFEIIFYTSNTSTFFNGELTPEAIDEYFKPIRKKYPKSTDNPPFKLTHYLKIRTNEKLIKRICKVADDLYKNDLKRLSYKGSSNRKIVFELFDNLSFEKLSSTYDTLDHMRKLGMVTAPEIKLKRVNGYSLQESSSGEYHFLSSIVGLIATISPTNSLILIDEPEISLHPNWQMKYLEFLRELFGHQEYSTCHTLVATHSHFLISDLKSESSKIIGLNRDKNGKISMVALPRNLNTYGWSAEEVLYRVFSVPSNRNHYFELKIARLLELLQEGKADTRNEVRDIISEMTNINLSTDDPLNEILEEAKSFIKQ